MPDLPILCNYQKHKCSLPDASSLFAFPFLNYQDIILFLWDLDHQLGQSNSIERQTCTEQTVRE